MFNKLPVFANKIYNGSSDHQDLYNQYKSMINGSDPSYVEEEMFYAINSIYWDFVNNGFGSDWSKEYETLASDLEDISELNYLSSYLDRIKKYSKGYKIDKSDILNVCEDLEQIMRDILDYIDKVNKWTKIKVKLDWN